MDNNKFDNIIKGKLESMSSDSAPRWDLFKAKLQSQDMKRADRDFDNVIRKSVAEYSVDYNPNHWSLLKSRLERIYAIRKSVFTAKSYEIIAILLLTFGISTHYDFLFETNSTPIAQVEKTNLTNTQLANHIPATKILTSTETATESIKEVNRVEVTNSIASNTSSSSYSSSSLERKNSTKLGNNSQVSSEVPSQMIPVSSTSDFVSTSTNNSLNITAADNAIAPISIESISQLSAQSITGLTSRDMVTIADNRFGITPSVVPSAKHFVHVVASFDNNIISTPYNEQYNSRGPSEAEMFGFTVSGLFSIQKGQWEYETGFGYSIYNKPANVPEYWDDNAGGVFKYTLSNVNYNILSAPLRVKYHFVSNPDWSLFVSGGLSPEFIVNTGYEETNEELNIQAPTPIDPVPGTPVYTEGPFRRNANFHNGLFQNGSLSDNFMLRAHAGFGMQRNITPTLSAYFSGQLFRSVLSKTYGPTDDTINKFSISFGLRERF